MYLLERMIASHTGWDMIMPPPRGGGRHADEIGQFWKQWADCQAIREEKCTSCSSSGGGGGKTGLAAFLAGLAYLAARLAAAGAL